MNGLDELNQYKWSGRAVLVGTVKNEWQSTGEIQERFGKTKTKAITKYIEFMRDGQSMGKRDDLIGGGLIRSAGGWEGVLRLKRNKEYWPGDERVVGDGDFVTDVLKVSEEEVSRKEKLKREGWNLEKLVEKVCGLLSI